MHSDRALIEERITRELNERVLPRVERSAVPLAVTAGPTPEQQSPFVVGSEWGPPWGTTWFVLTGAVPDEWSGQRVEAIIDLGFRADPPGFRAVPVPNRSAGPVAEQEADPALLSVISVVDRSIEPRRIVV